MVGKKYSELQYLGHNMLRGEKYYHLLHFIIRNNLRKEEQDKN